MFSGYPCNYILLHHGFTGKTGDIIRAKIRLVFCEILCKPLQQCVLQWGEMLTM